MSELSDRIQHAKSYPFARPACSYLFEDGAMRPLPRDATTDRTPVIASGSNASPSRLAAKFGPGHSIPVTRAKLRHFAVVFAGHFTAYGAIPATLYPHHGAMTDVWITWLTAEQLSVMHRSEGVIGGREIVQRYDYVELSGIELQPAGMAAVGEAGAYLSRRMFAPEGDPIRFAEIISKQSRLRSRPHNKTLRHAAALLRPELSFKAFMTEVLSTPTERQALFELLTPLTIGRADNPGAKVVAI